MTMNKGKCLQRAINSSLLSPSHPINQCPTRQDRPRHTNQQRGFKKISLPVPGDHLYISGYLPDGEGGGDQRKVLLTERPLIFLSISFWHLNQTHPVANRFLWELNFWTPAGTLPCHDTLNPCISMCAFHVGKKQKQKHCIYRHKHIFFRSFLTGNHLRLTPAVSWSLSLIFLTLNHTLSMLLPDNFFHCSQTPNRRELRGFRDNFRHSLQRQRLKDALEDVGVLPKCTFVWTHTQVHSHPDVIPVLLTLKWCFSLKPLILMLPLELFRWYDDVKFRGCQWCTVIRQLTAVIPV